jgi:hypothetical protein
MLGSAGLIDLRGDTVIAAWLDLAERTSEPPRSAALAERLNVEDATVRKGLERFRQFRRAPNVACVTRTACIAGVFAARLTRRSDSQSLSSARTRGSVVDNGSRHLQLAADGCSTRSFA